MRFRATTAALTGVKGLTVAVRVSHEVTPAYLLDVLMWHGDNRWIIAGRSSEQFTLVELSQGEVLSLVRGAIKLQEPLRMLPHRLHTTVERIIKNHPADIRDQIVRWAAATAARCFPELEDHPVIEQALGGQLP